MMTVSSGFWYCQEMGGAFRRLNLETTWAGGFHHRNLQNNTHIRTLPELSTGSRNTDRKTAAKPSGDGNVVISVTRSRVACLPASDWMLVHPSSMYLGTSYMEDTMYEAT
jgi:hypothetical protein